MAGKRQGGRQVKGVKELVQCFVTAQYSVSRMLMRKFAITGF